MSDSIYDDSLKTRLTENADEEIAGSLFSRDCPDLDTSIQRKNDNYIDECEVPDVPKGKLNINSFDPVDFNQTPEEEVPKKLMAKLLGCCLPGRTPGFDLTIEQGLDSNNQIKSIDYDTSLLNTTLQLGDDGYLEYGLNVQAETCFCDTDCNPDEDEVIIKINKGLRYKRGKKTNPDCTITAADIQRIVGNISGAPAGFFAKVVSYVPLECISKYAKELGERLYNEDEEFNIEGETSSTTTDSTTTEEDETPEELQLSHGNRWQYRLEKLEYVPCNTNCKSLDGTDIEGNLGDDDEEEFVIEGETTSTGQETTEEEEDEEEYEEGEGLLAYNINEFLNTDKGMEGDGLYGRWAWDIAFQTNPEAYDFFEKNVQRRQLMPCPVGSIVYVFSEEPEDCESEETPYLFHHANRDVSETPIIALGRIGERIDEKKGQVRYKVTVYTTLEKGKEEEPTEAKLHLLTKKNKQLDEKIEVEATLAPMFVKKTSERVDPAFPVNWVLIFMDSYGTYWALPGLVTVSGCGMLSANSEGSVIGYIDTKRRVNANCLNAYICSKSTNQYVKISSIDKVLDEGEGYLPTGIFARFYGILEIDNTEESTSTSTGEIKGKFSLTSYDLPIIEGYAACDIGSSLSKKVINVSSTSISGYFVELEEPSSIAENKYIKVVPSILLKNSTVETGTPVICQWSVSRGEWIITQAGCAPDEDHEDIYTDSYLTELLESEEAV